MGREDEAVSEFSAAPLGSSLRCQGTPRYTDASAVLSTGYRIGFSPIVAVDRWLGPGRGKSPHSNRHSGALIEPLEILAQDVDGAVDISVEGSSTFRRRMRVISRGLGEFAPIMEALIDWKNERFLKDLAADVKRAPHDMAGKGYAPGEFQPRGYKAEPVEIGKRRDGKPRIVARWVEDPEAGPLALLGGTGLPLQTTSGTGSAPLLGAPHYSP